MVQQLKSSRSSTTDHMTRAIGLINGFATRVMTQEDIYSIGVYESRLKSLYGKYQVTLKEIEEKLKAIKAAQEELDEKQNITLQTQEEVLGASAITKQKREEWLKAIETKKEEEKERRNVGKSNSDDQRPYSTSNGGQTGTSNANRKHNNSSSSSFSNTVNQIAATTNKAF
ncbi:hypothetical protein DAPPUDRAFT_114163 [Daphnia pulex]|uniref:Uncharacterized protein n=1 Tax=Daphnia pulex TaxID=6669 RepID=E9HH83_DAPPU|nr:hypothetical protein DAPPUDRAFT_114163 [Daphnia pulex]|eukprot:EFX68897.1 hypothetical protein DAPPUDRAFT_114163 [Daphnia pulex]